MSFLSREHLKMQNSDIFSLLKNAFKKRFSKSISGGVLIACSGGKDSVFLLHAMNNVAKEMGFKLGVVHINHNIREDSVKDSIFVKNLSEKMNLPFYGFEIDKGFFANGSNVESKARDRRYELISACALNEGYTAVATAHHLDDQVETLLMRLFDRGSGPRGLAGIKECRLSDGIYYIRPFLSVSRVVIDKFMEEKPFVYDITNSDIEIRRNFYRSEIIPMLESKLGTLFKANVARTAQTASSESIFTSEAASYIWESLKFDDLWIIPRKMLKEKSYNFWATMLSEFFSVKKGFSLSSKAIEDLYGFMKKGEAGDALYHPFYFKREKDRVVICYSDKES